MATITVSKELQPQPRLSRETLAILARETTIEFVENYQPKCGCPEHESCEECDRYNTLTHNLRTLYYELQRDLPRQT